MKKDREAMAEKGVGGQVMLDQLGVKQAQEKSRGTERESYWQAEREKMTQRAQLLRRALAEDLAKAQKKLSEFDVKFTECTEAWKAEDNRKSEHHEKLMVEWDKRIKDVSAMAGADPASVSAAQPRAAASVSTPMETEASSMEKDYHLEVKWKSSMAPVVKIENEPQRLFLGGLWCNLVEWHQAGRQFVMYQELVSADPKGIQALKQLLGAEFWSLLYGERVVGPQDVVPNQLKYVLKEILNKLAAKLTGEADAKAELEATAKANFERIQANQVSKRRRAA